MVTRTVPEPPTRQPPPARSDDGATLLVDEPPGAAATIAASGTIAPPNAPPTSPPSTVRRTDGVDEAHGRPTGLDDPSMPAAAAGTRPVGRYVPMTHRGSSLRRPPPVVREGPVAALLTVLVPIAVVAAFLLVPAGPVRPVLLLVGWVAFAVAVELRDTGSRVRRRVARDERTTHPDRGDLGP